MLPARFHPLLRLFLCAFATAIVVLAVQAVAFAWLLAPQLRAPGTIASAPLMTPRVIALAALLSAPGTLLAVRVCRHVLDRQSLRSLGLDMPRAVPHFCGGVLCGTLAITFLFALFWLTGHVEISGLSQRARDVGGGGIALRLCLWALAMLAVALTEELLFRGYALHNLGAWLGNDRTGLGAAAIIQAFVFGLIHMMNFGPGATPEKLASAWQALPNLTLIGIFFALCVFKTGSLWFPIGFHAAWNFLLGSVYSLPVSGNETFRLFDVQVNGSRWLTGGPFGAEGSVCLTAIIIAMIYVVRQSADQPDTALAIAQMWPREEDDEETALSRAPGLRERKEKRRSQAAAKPTFEGWNDLAPPERAPRYTPYRPTFPAPGGVAETTGANTPETAPEVVPASVIEEMPVAVAAPLAAVTETAPVAAPIAAPKPEFPASAFPESAFPEAQAVPQAAPETAPAPVVPAPAAPSAAVPPPALSPAPQTPAEPPKPPVKKPAPRW